MRGEESDPQQAAPTVQHVVTSKKESVDPANAFFCRWLVSSSMFALAGLMNTRDRYHVQYTINRAMLFWVASGVVGYGWRIKLSSSLV